MRRKYPKPVFEVCSKLSFRQNRKSILRAEGDWGSASSRQGALPSAVAAAAAAAVVLQRQVFAIGMGRQMTAVVVVFPGIVLQSVAAI